MSVSLDPLVMDLVAFVASGPRPYEEVIDAWRTSCPRLPVWEEANTRGYLAHSRSPNGVAQVTVTAVGLDHLRANRKFTPAVQTPPHPTSVAAPAQ